LYYAPPIAQERIELRPDGLLRIALIDPLYEPKP
jgi:hypothetical protein